MGYLPFSFLFFLCPSVDVFVVVTLLTLWGHIVRKACTDIRWRDHWADSRELHTNCFFFWIIIHYLIKEKTTTTKSGCVEINEKHPSRRCYRRWILAVCPFFFSRKENKKQNLKRNKEENNKASTRGEKKVTRNIRRKKKKNKIIKKRPPSLEPKTETAGVVLNFLLAFLLFFFYLEYKDVWIDLVPSDWGLFSILFPFLLFQSM